MRAPSSAPWAASARPPRTASTPAPWASRRARWARPSGSCGATARSSASSWPSAPPRATAWSAACRTSCARACAAPSARAPGTGCSPAPPARPRPRDGPAGLCARGGAAARRARAQGPPRLDPRRHAGHELGAGQLRAPGAQPALGGRQDRAQGVRAVRRGPRRRRAAQRRARPGHRLRRPAGRGARSRCRSPSSAITRRRAAAPRRSGSTRTAATAPPSPRRAASSASAEAARRRPSSPRRSSTACRSSSPGAPMRLQTLDASRPWLGEGSSAYAGCLFAQDGAAAYRKAYATYVDDPRPRWTIAPTTRSASSPT